MLDTIKTYWGKLNKEDQKTGNTLAKIIEKFKMNYNGNPKKAFEFLKNPIKSKLLESMFNSSAKMTKMMFLISVSPGSVMIYSI